MSEISNLNRVQNSEGGSEEGVEPTECCHFAVCVKMKVRSAAVWFTIGGGQWCSDVENLRPFLEKNCTLFYLIKKKTSVMTSGGDNQRLGAASETDRDAWISALHSAAYSTIRVSIRLETSRASLESLAFPLEGRRKWVGSRVTVGRPWQQEPNEPKQTNDQHRCLHL